MGDRYGHSSRDTAMAAVMGLWLLTCDAALKAIARIGGCADTTEISADLLAKLYVPPQGCAGTEMAGPAIRLVATTQTGALFGLGEGHLGGLNGQLYALALVAMATVVSILVLRSRRHSSGDARALGVLWAGALIHAAPRLAGEGAGLAELQCLGVPTGIGDLALLWGLVWLMLRFFGELRA